MNDPYAKYFRKMLIIHFHETQRRDESKQIFCCHYSFEFLAETMSVFVHDFATSYTSFIFF